MNHKTIFDRGKNLIDSIRRCEASATTAHYEVPKDRTVQEAEAELRRPIPKRLLVSLAGISRFTSWGMDSLSDDLPEQYEDVCSGNCRWDLDSMKEVDLDKQLFLKKKGKHLGKSARAKWDSAFAFHYVIDPSSSEFIALDSNDQALQPVIFLHGHRKAGHDGYVLAPSLDVFLDRWSRLAFVELNGYTLSLFTEQFTTEFSADGAFARSWLAWLIK